MNNDVFMAAILGFLAGLGLGVTVAVAVCVG